MYTLQETRDSTYPSLRIFSLTLRMNAVNQKKMDFPPYLFSPGGSLVLLVAHLALGCCWEDDKLQGPVGRSRQSHHKPYEQACIWSLVDDE